MYTSDNITHLHTQYTQHTTPHHTTTVLWPFFPGPPGRADAIRELLDFMVQGKINRGRHTDHPAGRHSIRTNQCPPPPSPHFVQAGCPSCRPTNSVKALKANAKSFLTHNDIENLLGLELCTAQLSYPCDRSCWYFYPHVIHYHRYVSLDGWLEVSHQVLHSSGLFRPINVKPAIIY